MAAGQSLPAMATQSHGRGSLAAGSYGGTGPGFEVGDSLLTTPWNQRYCHFSQKPLEEFEPLIMYGLRLFKVLSGRCTPDTESSKSNIFNFVSVVENEKSYCLTPTS